ncbi:MAG: CapA family protein [Spirochaetia bacterium]
MKTASAFILLIFLTFSCRVSEPVYEEPETPSSEYQFPQDHGPLLLSFCGDIMAHDINYLMEDYNDIYTEASEYLQDDDVSFGNLEFPIDPTRRYSTYPRFNVQPDYVEAAIHAGFDAFSLANNHTNDLGTEGVLRTFESMQLLQQEHSIFFSGIRRDTDFPFLPAIIEHEGHTIAFLSVTSLINYPQGIEYTNYINLNSDDERSEFLSLIQRIDNAYEAVIVSFHGGVEYRQEPSERKQEFFRELIFAGADIVWGHHPHVLQPYELITVNNTDKLILYSCGNFISAQTWIFDYANPYDPWAATGDTAIFQVELNFHENEAEVQRVIPRFFTAQIRDRKDIVLRNFHRIQFDQTLSHELRQFYAQRLAMVRDRIIQRQQTQIPQDW